MLCGPRLLSQALGSAHGPSRPAPCPNDQIQRFLNGLPRHRKARSLPRTQQGRPLEARHLPYYYLLVRGARGPSRRPPSPPPPPLAASPHHRPHTPTTLFQNFGMTCPSRPSARRPALTAGPSGLIPGLTLRTKGQVNAVRPRPASGHRT